MTSAMPRIAQVRCSSITQLTITCPMDATTLAHELVGIHESAALVPPFSEQYPGLTPETGYAAARKLHAHRCARGWKPVGRKIGFTNRTLWDRYGVHEPMWGTVYDRTLVFSSGSKA